jgi:hypothetical protein
MRARSCFIVAAVLMMSVFALPREAAATGGTHCHHNSCNGTSGENGQNGANGQNGENGQNGQNGQNGVDGRDGRDGRTTEIPVATAYAAPVIATEDTCMGSSSVGAQGVAFGVSIGTTWRDSNCQRLKNSRELAAMGFGQAAVALLCVDEDVSDAMRTAGTPCPGQQLSAEAATTEPSSRPRQSGFSFFRR